MSQPLPDEFRDAARLLREHLPFVLGSNFVGLYVYGSALDPTFVPGRSDLDCLLVTEAALDAAGFDALSTWLAQTAGQEPSLLRVQMSILVGGRVLEDDPGACLYQFGVLSRRGSDGNPIVWLDFYARGLVLLGPDPHEFVPEITPVLLHAALVREVGYLREEISTKRGERVAAPVIVSSVCGAYPLPYPVFERHGWSRVQGEGRDLVRRADSWGSGPAPARPSCRRSQQRSVDSRPTDSGH